MMPSRTTAVAGGEPQDGFLIEQVSATGAGDRQVAAALDYHRQVEGRQPLSRTLVELGLASDESVARWIAAYHGWRYVPREELRVVGDAHKGLPESISRNRHAVVTSLGPSGYTVAVADPTCPQFDQVRYALEDTAVEWVVSPQADIDALVSEVFRASIDVRENELERFVEDMIRKAAHTRGLSDIHCIPDERCCEIRWRIDGELVPWGTLPGSMKETVSAQLKLSSTRGPDGKSRGASLAGGLDVANRLETQDASTVREYGSKRVSLRYSVVPAVNGESIVIRVLDQGTQIGSLEDLGMLEDTAMSFRAGLKRPNGIVLVSGPTGHGKSTTLAAAVPCLDARSKRILSVEDPVEYRMRSVTQAPVSPRMPFAAALRAFLRHNPDIVIVGEIRDAETASLAMRLALTGHLIITTVHANTAVQAISRLLDLGVEAPMLASTARLLVGQRLVKRLCTGCRQPHRKAAALATEQMRLFRAARDSGLLARTGSSHPEFFEAGGGCPMCRGSGFSGRTGIFEFREMGSRLSDLLVRQRSRFDPCSAESLFGASSGTGDIAARTMREDGMLKAALGMAAPEEVLGATLDAAKAP